MIGKKTNAPTIYLEKKNFVFLFTDEDDNGCTFHEFILGHL